MICRSYLVSPCARRTCCSSRSTSFGATRALLPWRSALVWRTWPSASARRSPVNQPRPSSILPATGAPARLGCCTRRPMARRRGDLFPFDDVATACRSSSTHLVVAAASRRPCEDGNDCDERCEESDHDDPREPPTRFGRHWRSSFSPTLRAALLLRLGLLHA